MAFDWEKYGITPKTGGTQRDIQHNIDKLYQNVVGRNADPGGRDYWSSKIGTNVNDYNTLLSGLTSSQEYKDRLSAVNAGNAAGIEVPEAQLDMLPSAYVSPFHAGSGSAVAGWKPGDRITEAIAQAGVDNYSDQTNKTVYDVNAANNVINSTGGVGYVGGTSGTPASTNPTVTTDPNDPGYLTNEGLTAWWDALDKPWLNQGTDTETGTGGTDDFMKFMMFMSMMRPQGGGYGGSQYGYGGMNPGGVQSAYNPMDNMQGYMDAFRNIPGIGTGLANVTGT